MATPNGQAIGMFRKSLGLTRAEFSKVAKISSKTLSRAERGMEVSHGTLGKIASALSKFTNKPVGVGQIASSNPPHTNLVISKIKFTELVRDALLVRGLTQRNLAEMIQVEPTTVSRWVNGLARPAPHNLSKIYRALDIDASEMEAFGIAPRAEQFPRSRPERLVTTAESIPDQNPLVRFGISENAKLNLVPTLVDKNDYDTIELLRSELLAAKGPIDHLKERYAQNANVPQASLFGPLTSKYGEELSKDPREINYTILYARGARFYAARRTATQQVASGEWPELDAGETDAINAICDLHGPLIMASAVGRKLVEDAHQYEVPPDVYERDQETIEEFGQVIAAETELMEPEAAEAYRELTTRTEGDLQPARSRGLGIAATGSALTVIVGGAAWYGAGGAVATIIVPAAALGAAGLVGGFFWEAIKTMPRFKRATSEVGNQFENALDKAEKHADQKERALLEGMADLVERKRPLFERVANLRPEFGWAKKFIHRPTPRKQANYFDVVEAVNTAVRSQIDSAGKANIAITVQLPHTELLAAGERQNFVFVLNEIITNAIVHNIPVSQSEKHRAARWIEVKALGKYGFKDDEQVPREILVEITYSGTVNPASDFSRNFTPQLRGSNAQVGGRGLSVARSLMEQNEGSFTASISEHGGLTISLHLNAYHDA